MTRDSVLDVPNQPKTPQRSIRVADDIWLAAKAKAEAEGQTVSDVVRQALEEYLSAEGDASA